MTPRKKLISAFSEVIEILSNDFVPKSQVDKMAERLVELEKRVKELSEAPAGEAASGGKRSGRAKAGARKKSPRKRTYKADYLKLINLLVKDPQREFTLKELVRGTGYNEKKVRNMIFIYSREKFGYIEVVRRGVYKAGKPVDDGQRAA